MNAPWNAPISDRFSSLCARVFSPAAAILESEKTLGTRLHFLLRFVIGRTLCYKNCHILSSWRYVETIHVLLVSQVIIIIDIFFCSFID